MGVTKYHRCITVLSLIIELHFNLIQFALPKLSTNKQTFYTIVVDDH